MSRRCRKARALGAGFAEAKGFEPLVGCPTPVFKTGAFDRSATLPPRLVAEIRGLVKEEFVLKVRGQRPFGGRMGSSLGSTMAAMNVAISGIADAERLHERAALDVQRSFHGPDSPSPLRPPDEGAGGQATTLTLSGQAGDLAAAMTTMMKAETYNKANVAVLKTADEMTRQLMDIVG